MDQLTLSASAWYANYYSTTNAKREVTVLVALYIQEKIEIRL